MGLLGRRSENLDSRDRKNDYFCNKIQHMGTHAATKLSSLQLELLKIFSFHPTEEELLQVKAMLAHFFAKRFSERVEQAADTKGISDEYLDRWLNEENQ